MLKRVKVKNVALIDETEIVLGNHLNILTGETGAGKSILIDSIHLALGAKADKSLIRSGCEYAFVELEFMVENKETCNTLKELEVFPEEDGSVLLQRKIMPGKSTLKINGETVSLKTMRDAAGLLIDIHGQNEHQSLLQEKRHREFLDAFCGDAILEQKQMVQKAFLTYKEAEKEYQEALLKDENKERDIALAKFELMEIEEADLTEQEDVSLEAEFKKMDNVRAIGQLVVAASNCLEGNEADGAVSRISLATKSLQQAMQYDEGLQDTLDTMLQTEDLLRECLRFLNRYLDQLEVDEERYVYVSERLNMINHLKKKYGNAISDILLYGQKQQQFIEKFENFEAYKENLQKQLDDTKKVLILECEKLSKIRREFASRLSSQLKDALVELNFLHVEFETEVVAKEEHISKDGYDQVRFMISLNAGEGLKPLSQVASGGELSRIMLALKAVLAKQEQIESLIFDEIDAGISGTTAWKVSEKLAVLGKEHQVICITHLPQIAAMADQHYRIEKTQTKDVTQTNLTHLDYDGQIAELARLLGSDMVTDAVLQNARELKALAIQTKEYKG